MNVFTQDARLGRLTTVLGPEALVLMRFDGSEALNGLFDYSVEALATRDNLDFDALLGTHATVSISGAEGPALFDGIITEARWKGPGENGWRYDLRLRPWFWLAGKRRNQRIFHNKTVVEILQELLMDYGHLGNPHLEIALSNDYPELEYTVQYRESDLDFARRLMERFGISFHIRHQEASHTLVLSDDVLNHAEIPPRPYYGASQNKGAQGEHFWAWGPERRLTTGATRLTDYNFKTPTAAMESDRIGDAAYAEGQLEAYDYPGGYLDLGRGKTVAQLRCEEERGHDARQFASGDITGLRPGGVVPLQGGDAVPGDGAKHLCLWARYSFVSQSYGSNRESSSADRPFTADYRLMPLTAPMVPPRVTPLPVVQGPQTAVVVGEGEIDCDEHGRILVHFHWDLEKAWSMRCRVSQNWASQGWGGMVIPRIGMEVVVEFLEGDPDKPLITGCVYNGRNRPPYPLPQNKTKSVFRTDTHQGKGFNELRLEDENGIEEIFIRAQHDRTEKTLNNMTSRIDKTQVVSVGKNRFVEVAKNEAHHVGGNFSLSVTGSGSETFSTHRLQQNWQGIRPLGYSLGQQSDLQNGRGNLSLFAQNNASFSSGSALSLIAGTTFSQSVSEDATANYGRKKIETVGASSRLMVGKSYFVDAAEEVTLRCGASKIKMSADGKIELTGTHILMNAGRIDLN